MPNRKAYHCRRCGHDWTPRIFAKPKSCPRCRSYRWDEEKKNA